MFACADALYNNIHVFYPVLDPAEVLWKVDEHVVGIWIDRNPSIALAINIRGIASSKVKIRMILIKKIFFLYIFFPLLPL